MSERAGKGWRGKADQVYEQLRTQIISGELPPGRPLPETELVEASGASRTPVREAVRRLAGEGLLELAPRRAPVVSRISLRSARELYAFRRILEPEAIKSVALLVAEDAARAEPYAKLRDEFVELNKDQGSPTYSERFGRLAERFDVQIATDTPNRYLSQAIKDVRPHSARLRRFAHTEPTRMAGAVAEHIGLCELIIAGDAEGAAVAMVAHLTRIEEAIFRQLLARSSDLLDI